MFTRIVAHTPLRVYNSLQAGRAIAALMVVAFHCAAICGSDKYWNHPLMQYFRFGDSGVEFFFVLSGVVIFHAHRKDLGRSSRLKSYIWKRFRRVYPIYWIFLTGMIVTLFLVPSYGKASDREPIYLLSCYLLFFITRMASLVPTSWSLDHEILFYVFFGAAIANRRVGLAGLSVWMVASIYGALLPPDHVLTAYISPFHLLFAFGMLVCVVIQRYSFPALAFALSGSMAFAALCLVENLTQAKPPALVWCLGIAAAIAIIGVMRLEEEGKLGIPRIMKFLGDASYSIYLVHYMVLSAAAKLLYRFCRQHQIVSIAVPYCILFVVAVASGCAMNVLIERPLMRLFFSHAVPRDTLKVETNLTA